MAAKKKTKTVKKDTIRFPQSVLTPVGGFLRDQLKNLKDRRKKIAADDPFRDVSRISDNAAPDADAEEQFGHARTSAIKEELDRKIIQTRKALSRVRLGKYGVCESCGNMIDTDRLTISPETTLCVKCAKMKEKKS